jgi:hypothetical protein
MAAATLYSQLKPCLLECPLMGQPFLPLDILDKKITKENVHAELPWKGRFLQRNLTNKVIIQAKKVFVVLVFTGEPLAIGDLLKEGLTDEDLPLSRKPGENDNILVSCSGKKTFRSFEAWRKDAQVTNFLEKQWYVLAPVLDTTGNYFILDQKCALPFPKVEEVGGGHFSTVYKSALHPAHQQGFQVSIPSNRPAPRN